MNFQYNYNLSGGNRKPLVEAISQILVKPAVYQGAPSFAYTIGGCVVDRNGILSGNGNTDSEAVKMLVEALRERGFVAENVAAEDTAAEETIIGESDTEEAVVGAAMSEVGLEESATGAEAANKIEEEENAMGEAEEIVTANTSEAAPDAGAPTNFVVEVPGTGFTPETRENLKKIVASKETLLKQALGSDSLPIVELDGKIAFPWFTLHGLDGEADAYNRLVVAICKMAKNQKRVTAAEKPVENAKFDMRLFLVRLGFVGDEYKTARKILLRNLTGNSAWKSGHKPERLAGNAENGTMVTDTGHTDADVLAEEMSVDTEVADSLENKNEGGEDYDK